MALSIKEIKEKQEREILITSRYDLCFKTIMQQNKDILEKVLEDALERKVQILEFLPTELPIRHITERQKTLDLIAKCENEYFEIEVNTSVGLESRIRNLSYFFSFISQRIIKNNEYNTKTKYIQVNLSYGMDKHYSPNTYDLFEEYKIQTDSNKIYGNNVSIVEINMECDQGRSNNLIGGNPIWKTKLMCQ